MKYSINFFGENCEQIWNLKTSKFDIIKTIELLNIEIGYKCASHINETFRSILFNQIDINKNWEFEVASDFYHKSSLPRCGKKAVDIRNSKDKVDVEIEMGNVASAYRDLTKFNLHYNSKKIDLGIIILCTHDAVKVMGENIANYERTLDELNVIYSNNPPGHCPVVVIGILPFDNYGNSLIDVSSSEKLKELQKARSNK